MATREGARIAYELAAKGWQRKPLPEGIHGDCKLIDPETGEEYDPFEAEQIQQEREQAEEKT